MMHAPEGLVAQTVSEIIGAVTSEPVRRAIIGSALVEARRSSIPETGPDVLDFADGPLRRALAGHVGLDVAAELLAQVRPLLERASKRPSIRATYRAPEWSENAAAELERQSSVAPQSSIAPRAMMTDPAPASAPFVVYFATRDADASSELARSLAGAATVRVCNGLFELIDELDTNSDESRMLIVDGGVPSIRIPSLLTIAADLVGRTRILVWRPTQEDFETLQSCEGDWSFCDGPGLASLLQSCGEFVPL